MKETITEHRELSIYAADRKLPAKMKKNCQSNWINPLKLAVIVSTIVISLYKLCVIQVIEQEMFAFCIDWTLFRSLRCCCFVRFRFNTQKYVFSLIVRPSNSARALVFCLSTVSITIPNVIDLTGMILHESRNLRADKIPLRAMFIVQCQINRFYWK